jgi:N-acetylglucosaminyldiphosphoundecaprenol N-acetyl-beta-D-mannosaminyltransferase
MTARYPGLQVAGTYAPPFRPLNFTEEAELSALILETKPDIMWIGLGSPKQEHFMAQYYDKLDVKLMVGVGAAFDIHSGNVKEAPRLLKSVGLQWLHRLTQEPQRLWRRYLTCVPSFMWNMSLQLLGIRKFDIEA